MKTDWLTLHKHLEDIQSRIERGFELSEEEKKKILRERAKKLAQESDKKDTVEEYVTVLEFLLAHERYAIETQYIHEVYPMKDVTPLPCIPPFIVGIMNIRGQIISVVDIKKFFDLPEKGMTNLNKVIVVKSNKTEFGILTDEILGIRIIPFSEIQPSFPTLTGIQEEYLKGIATERLIVLDIEKILSDKRLVIHEEVET